MKNPVSIIMYHYIRDLKRSRFPEIKGLTIEEFEEQIAYIKKHYTVISGQHILSAIASDEELPPQSLMLTFDDGYLDHFTNVFTVLDREGLSACFFPSAKCVIDRKVMDVNKIQFILACITDKNIIVNKISELIYEYKSQFSLENFTSYWDRLAIDERFDSKEVVFIKRLLQRELPEELRKIFIDKLFKKYVSSDEASFANDLYMSMEHLHCLHRHGMYIGSHGYDHHWLNNLSPSSQKLEIDLSLNFLNEIHDIKNGWIFCYPFGAYNDSLLNILKFHGCKLGLTTNVGIAYISNNNHLTLPRLDTNDLPKNRFASANRWTKQILSSNV